MYKAKNVDTDKALNYINESRRYQQQAETLEITSVQKYHDGIRKGLDIAEEIFTSSNCESKNGTYQEGVMDVKEFFEKAKAICEHYSDKECPCCPLDEFCDAGIFAMNSEKTESVIDIVKGFDLTQLN